MSRGRGLRSRRSPLVIVVSAGELWSVEQICGGRSSSLLTAVSPSFEFNLERLWSFLVKTQIAILSGGGEHEIEKWRAFRSVLFWCRSADKNIEVSFFSDFLFHLAEQDHFCDISFSCQCVYEIHQRDCTQLQASVRPHEQVCVHKAQSSHSQSWIATFFL